MKPCVPCLLALAVLLAAPCRARADTIHLKDGRVLEGEIEEEEPGRIRLRMRLGAVWIPRDDIARIELEPTPRESYDQRRKALADDDADGWLALGVHCLEHGMEAEGEDCLRKALVADPALAAARSRLDAIHAVWTLKALLESDDPEHQRRLEEDFARFGTLGLEAARRALDERERRLAGLLRRPEGLFARLAEEFKSLRESLLRTVRDESRYNDRDEDARARVAARVLELRSFYRDPSRPEYLALYPPLQRLNREMERLLALLAGTPGGAAAGAPPAIHPKGRIARLVALNAPLRGLNPNAQWNAKAAEHNEVAAEAWKLPENEREGVAALNEYREIFGLRILRINEALRAAAAGHSKAMDERDFFSHESPLPGLKTPFARIRKAGYEFRVAGENIARRTGGLGPVQALEAWIASPAHHRNLLEADFEDVGLGIHGIYWTLNLGARRREEEKR